MDQPEKGDGRASTCVEKDMVCLIVPSTETRVFTTFAIDLWTPLDIATPESIYFRYENQIKFPPPDSVNFFDSEAIFVFNDSIYLLIKDRSKPFVGKTFLYQIPFFPSDNVCAW